MAATVGDNPQPWGLVTREVWRRVRRRLRVGPLYAWRFSGRTPERVLIAPPDLRLADHQIASEIYAGRFPLGGHLVETGGESPFRIDVANRHWLESLHGFRWLRHMRAAGTDLAAANARALVNDWIAIHGGRIEGLAWEPRLVAMRIIAWLQHSTIVLQGADFRFYRAFLRSLAMQLRYLRIMASEMPPGEDLLRARMAIAFAALSLPLRQSSLRAATRNLAYEIEQQILPDGGHASRSPLAVLELLADMLPLRQTYTNQAETPPPALINAVERMLPMLRFFRHQNGNLAHFNGVGATIPDRIVAILQHDETQGAPLNHAPHSGYERLHMNRVTVIADTGKAPPADMSGSAHAGALSFEMSSGRDQFIVNCGVDSVGDEEFRLLARITAAHSTAAINDSSSARFSSGGWAAGMIGAPLVNGPKKVAVSREDTAHQQHFTASHDGYASRFGLVHERSLTLRDNGAILDGCDRFFRPNGKPVKPGKDEVALRFHVHPSIAVAQDELGQVTLTATDGDAWVFTCAGPAPEISESVFFAGLAGPVRTRQFTIGFHVSDTPEICWRLTRVHAR